MNKATNFICVICVLCLIAAMVLSLIEVRKETQNWKPTEIYEFTNKNIDWAPNKGSSIFAFATKTTALMEDWE